MQITNNTKGDLGLDPQTIVPAGGFLEIDNETLTAFKINPIVKHWFVTKQLTESGAVEAEEAPTDADRVAIVSGIIRGLKEDEFTNGGKPEVDAINAALPKDAAKVNAAERDAVWADMKVPTDQGNA